MTTPPRTATSETILSAFGNNTGIVVPDEAIAALDAGKRPPVDVDVNGYTFRNTVGSMKGQSLISVSAAIRKQTGLAAGDPITVRSRRACSTRRRCRVAIRNLWATAGGFRVR